MSIQVMVNGIPGNMGRIVAETCVARGLELVPYSLTGEIIVENEAEVAGKTIQLLKPSNREARIGEVLAKYPNMICIDYTHPTAVNDNAAFYVNHKIPFVMGTTGGDREALTKLVAEANHPSVIAPNMAKQIVAFQTMIEFLAKEFPTAFSGYKLSVVESHQKTKADTSPLSKATRRRRPIRAVPPALWSATSRRWVLTSPSMTSKRCATRRNRWNACTCPKNISAVTHSILTASIALTVRFTLNSSTMFAAARFTPKALLMP